MKVAYVIATYAKCGGRLTAIEYPPDTSTYMSLHMDKLREADVENLDNIFILKAAAPKVDEGFYNYSSEGLPDIKEIDYPNMAQSYGQWAKFLLENDDFDYYILIEDDYCLNNSNAISLLVSEHRQRLPGGGFLCSKILDNPRHAGISNGVVDGKIIREMSSRIDFLKHITTAPVKEYNNKPVYQINFATMFGDKLADIADKYSVPYWVNEFIEYGIKGAPTLFVPSQYTDNKNSDLIRHMRLFQ
jgi:hypothetical protein